MDFSMGPRPQDSFVPPVNNSNQPQLQPWQSALPDCPALEPGDPPGMHPLQKRLAGLEYQPWQLEAPEPILPEVNALTLTYTLHQPPAPDREMHSILYPVRSLAAGWKHLELT